MKRRLLITDMDNTLLDSRTRVSRENLDAIRRHVEGGGLFTIASGRAPASVRVFPELLELINAPAITGNGGQVCDLHTGEVFYRKTLPEEAGSLVAAALDQFPLMGAVAYYGAEGFSIFRGNEHTDDLIRREGRPARPDTVEGCPRPWNKSLMTAEHEYMLEVRDFLAPRLNGMGRLVFSEATFLELLPVGVSKGDALKVLLERMGLKAAEAVAMGDAPNDREMLIEAGLGVAVANADAEIKAVADAQVCDHDSHAVRECLERFF